VLAALVLAAFVAGLVDAIAGGGGLLTLPALLAAGLPAHAALATNKGQSVFGSGASLWEFARKGGVDRLRAPWAFGGAALGAVLGVRLVLVLDPAVLRPLVLGLLLAAAALAFTRKPAVVPSAPKSVPRAWLLALGTSFVIGTYDGFFGPGTGTFLILAYAYLFGDGLVSASANAKVANFASNLGSFVVFALSGHVLWKLALPMGLAQAAGAVIGTHLTLRKGAGLVRAAAVTVSLLLAARVGWQLVTGR
jgi:uncharacterized membrane protein YfcA